MVPWQKSSIVQWRNARPDREKRKVGVRATKVSVYEGVYRCGWVSPQPGRIRDLGRTSSHRCKAKVAIADAEQGAPALPQPSAWLQVAVG